MTSTTKTVRIGLPKSMLVRRLSADRPPFKDEKGRYWLWPRTLVIRARLKGVA